MFVFVYFAWLVGTGVAVYDQVDAGVDIFFGFVFFIDHEVRFFFKRR